MITLVVYPLAVCKVAFASETSLTDPASCQDGYPCPSNATPTIGQPGTITGEALDQPATCNDCDPGYYQSYAGQRSCLECPDGYQCPYARTITPLICPPGSRGGRNVTDKYGCYDCGTGYYQQFAGRTTCDPCPVHVSKCEDQQSGRMSAGYEKWPKRGG